MALMGLALPLEYNKFVIAVYSAYLHISVVLKLVRRKALDPRNRSCLPFPWIEPDYFLILITSQFFN